METSRFLLIKLTEYETYLLHEERSVNTIKKYVRDVHAFLSYLAGNPLSKDSILAWKKYLLQRYMPASINSMLAALNGFLKWIGFAQFQVKPIKIQRALFQKQDKELRRSEYVRLVKTAQKMGNQRLSMLLQTICATGIRVSEIQYVTVPSIRTGRAEVACKGKTRIIFLSCSLCKALAYYCRKNQIRSGIIFRTKEGNPLDRSNIWRQMKKLCKKAGVAPEKVFPHNLRHLFARTYYTLEKDLSRLADLLGHSNIATTRIYTMESGYQHIRQLDKMNLVLMKE